MYPEYAYGPEVMGLISLFIIQFNRLHIGRQGNKNEHSGTIIFFILLCLPSIVGFLFYGRLQTYVLLLEYILNYIAGILCVFELLFGIKALLAFKKGEKTE
jgi:hypothetical protein